MIKKQQIYPMWWHIPAIPTIWRVRMGGSLLEFSLVKNYSEILSQKEKISIMIQICNPSFAGSRGRKIAVQGQPQAKSPRPYLRNKLKCKGMGSGSNFILFF
jgi:hypothetical protein